MTKMIIMFRWSAMLKVGDVRKFLPFANNLTLVSVNGSVLQEIFVTSATGLGGKIDGIPIVPYPDWGQFLQVSAGIRVTYGIKMLTENSHSSYLKSLRVLNPDEIFQEVVHNSNYNLLLPTFIFNGRGGYHFLPEAFAKVGYVDSIPIGE